MKCLWGNKVRRDEDLEEEAKVSQLHPEVDEDNSGDPGKPPLCWEKERDDYEEKDGNDMFLQQDWGSNDGETHNKLLLEG